MNEEHLANPILRPEVNCWRIEPAHRAALLVDGADYFAAFRAAVAQARHSVFIIGWDINSRVELVRDGSAADELPSQLGKFLNAVAERNRDLQIYVLAWDFAMLYALDREFLPLYRLGWSTHRRLHFRLDDAHPVGASQHQKMVVVDDAVAFVGGIDLTKQRWDTTEHRPGDPRRRDPDGASYSPFHDVQLMVDGKVAAAVGELARERWRRATGKRLRPSPSTGREAWPSMVKPCFTDIKVAIARTEPCYRDYPLVQEVKHLYIDAIHRARRWIYLENQYFTAPEIGQALGQRLQEPDGPEVILVSRVRGGGWLEESTMGTLRARLVNHLKSLDRHGRLRCFYPDRADLAGEPINVHSKLMVVDHRLLRLGSANLSNRSMGYDSECDLAIESTDAKTEKAIRDCRDRLLAEHLGISPGQLTEKIESTGSLISAIEACRHNGRSLKPLEPDIDPRVDSLLPDVSVIDPEKPIDPDQLTTELVAAEVEPNVRGRLALIISLLLILSALAALWGWTPVKNWINEENLVDLALSLQALPASPLWILGAFAVGSLLAVPITLMIVATVLVFGTFYGFAYAYCGALFGAAATFWLGHRLGRDTVRRIAGARLNQLSRRLGRRGLLAVLALRLVPVAPFAVVNLVAGASHVSARDFLAGTVLGMAPGIMAASIFSDRLRAFIKEPSPSTMALLGLVLAGLGAGAFAIRYWFKRRADKQQSKAPKQPGANNRDNANHRNL